MKSGIATLIIDFRTDCQREETSYVGHQGFMEIIARKQSLCQA